MPDRLVRAVQPAFSPDVAPSDFVVFRKMKMVLMGAIVNTDDKV
jgi:hypothetical protein